jgi:hypothetical protein
MDAEYQGLPRLRVGNVYFMPARSCDVRPGKANPGDYALPARRVSGTYWVTPFVPRRFITSYAMRRNLPVRAL